MTEGESTDEFSPPLEFSVSDHPTCSNSYLSVTLTNQFNDVQSAASIQAKHRQSRCSEDIAAEFTSVEIINGLQSSNQRFVCSNCGHKQAEFLCPDCIYSTTNFTIRKCEFEEKSSYRDNLLARFVDHSSKCDNNEDLLRIKAKLSQIARLNEALRLLAKQRSSENERKRKALMHRSIQRLKKAAVTAKFKQWLSTDLESEVLRHEQHLQQKRDQLTTKRLLLLDKSRHMCNQIMTVLFPIEEYKDVLNVTALRRHTEAELSDAQKTLFIDGKWVRQEDCQRDLRLCKISNCRLPSSSKLNGVRDQLFREFATSPSSALSQRFMNFRRGYLGDGSEGECVPSSTSIAAESLAALAHTAQLTALLCHCFAVNTPYQINHYNLVMDVSSASQFDTVVLQLCADIYCLCTYLGVPHIDLNQPLNNLLNLMRHLPAITDDYCSKPFTIDDNALKSYWIQRNLLTWTPIERSNSVLSGRTVTSGYSLDRHDANGIEDWECLDGHNVPAPNMSSSMFGDMVTSATHSVIGKLFTR